MKAGAVIDEFRLRAFDTVKPYLWTDAEVLSYLGQAQNDWVRLTGGIRDSQSEVTYLSVPSGAEAVELDKRVLKVVAARRADTGKRLNVYTVNSIEASEPTITTGTLHGFVCGEDEAFIRPVYIPTTDYEVRLIVDRLPLNPVDVNKELEVREDQALKLVFGMLSLAYSKPDPDVYNEDKRMENATLFEAEARKAFAEKRRRSGSAGVVAYGGL